MSQYCESFHLRTEDRAEAVDLLKRAGLHGFAFPATNGWVSFVYEGEPFVVNERLLSANHGYLLQFAYSDDHGWSFVIIRRNEIVFAYDSPGLDFPGTSAAEAEDARFPRHFDWLPESTRRKLWVLLFAKPGTINHLEIAFQFAELVGLVHYKGISYDTVMALAASNTEIMEVQP